MTIDVGQSLLRVLIFLVPIAVIGLGVCMFFWERTCSTKIKVDQIKSAGGMVTHYVPKEGNEIKLSNPKTGWSGSWAISDLATIPMPYPDLAGFLPRFLQREIQTAIIVEGDIEPLLNRSVHRENVASPNVVKALESAIKILEGHKDIEGYKETEDVIKQINYIITHTATSPTRELIASPDWLASIEKSTALKALASLSDDLLESLKQIRNQLARFAGLNSTYVYIGLLLIIVLLGFNLYYTIQGSKMAGGLSPDIIQKIDAIYYQVMNPPK